MSQIESRLQQSAAEAAIQIAIDGPAGAGKSTLGAALARALNCAALDTGLMYRAVTEKALRTDVSPADADALVLTARDLRFRLAGDTGELMINDTCADAYLRTAEVDAAVSTVSAHADLRRILVEQQRALATGRCIVMIGRDIGTTVLPDAPVKLWITASTEERARRRRNDQQYTHPGNGDGSDQSLKVRDSQDASRVASPLRQADDAHVIATDGLSADEVLAIGLRIVATHLEGEA